MRVQASLALGYVRSEHYRPEAEFAIEILGERRAAPASTGLRPGWRPHAELSRLDRARIRLL